MNPKAGSIKFFSNGDPIRFADAAVVVGSGKIYLSDASTRLAPRDWGGTLTKV